MRTRYYVMLAALAAPFSVNAAVINFDTVPANSIFGPSYSEAGYTLTGSGYEFPQFDFFTFTTFAGDGSLTLNYKGPTYTLTRDDHRAFDFKSFDLGNVNGNTFGGTLRVAFDGGTPVEYAIPTVGTLETIIAGGVGVTSVAFSYLPGETAINTDNSYARLDNLSLAVPEPASWALMLVGFGAVGGALRRRAPVGARLNFAR